ncbi:UDP-N-acetylmuramoyl-L-alanyl-D-glutamate--2,6-diaminopimelate ligase [Jeotgalibacillus marinus]|uniref:UDP-N-acetylmuramoyl-L-alanyl-D-glutamate--2,6-diaminopimelate ligase n=1 Tax=Jeotgalibacillus marinus TaxID=86667 RepID=A0ABV3Q4F4_9BACL
MFLADFLSTLYPIKKEWEHIPINDICVNIDSIKKNDLFIFTKGQRFDPHLYYKKVELKAAFFISEVPLNTTVPMIVDPDVSRKIGLIASSFLNSPSKSFINVAITGTNGKTSIGQIIDYLFTDLHRTSYIGTLGFFIGGEQIFMNRKTPTTPPPIDLQRMLLMCRKKKVGLNVMEVSSHALQQGRVTGIEYKYNIFSNLTLDHLDFHQTMENYANSKALLFKNATEQSFSIINIDDPYSLKMCQETKSRVITYSIDRDSDCKAVNIMFSEKGTSFDILYKNKRLPFQTKLVGKFNIYNLLSCILIGFMEGLSYEHIKEKIASFEGIPGRLEKVPSQKRNVFIDYAHTPDSLENVLTALNDFKKEGKILTVFGCGGDRDKSKRSLMGEVSGRISDLTIVTSDNPRSEDPKKILNEIAFGLQPKNSFLLIDDRKKAIAKAIELSTVKDLIIVAGKGHETYQILNDRTIEFDDKKITEELLSFIKN